MSHDRQRRDGKPSNELARLAQQGQARLEAAKRGQSSTDREAAERNLRIALGPVRGAPLRRAVLVLLVLSLPLAVAAVVGTTALGPAYVPLTFGALFGAAGLFFLYMFLPPSATRAGVEAERAWAAALPFALEHYFDVLSQQPSGECRLRVELSSAGTTGVDRATVQGIIALFDTDSQVVDVVGRHASFTTGPISGSTGIRINRVFVHRNHRLGTAVHRLVDVVLMPIHRNTPLTRVKLSREF